MQNKNKVQSSAQQRYCWLWKTNGPTDHRCQKSFFLAMAKKKATCSHGPLLVSKYQEEVPQAVCGKYRRKLLQRLYDRTSDLEARSQHVEVACQNLVGQGNGWWWWTGVPFPEGMRRLKWNGCVVSFYPWPILELKARWKNVRQKWSRSSPCYGKRIFSSVRCLHVILHLLPPIMLSININHHKCSSFHRSKEARF